MTSSPLPVTLTLEAGEQQRRLRLVRTCGLCLIVGCTVLMVPGSILVVLGTREHTGDHLIRKPGIILVGVALAGISIGCLMYCCVRKYREKHIAETILLKRQSTYSLASAHSPVRSHHSDVSVVRERSRSPVSPAGSHSSYCRQASTESHRSMMSCRQSSMESSRRSLASLRQSSVESRRSISNRQSSVESSRPSLSSMRQASIELSPGRAMPIRQSSFDLHPPSQKLKVPYRQASCDIYTSDERWPPQTADPPRRKPLRQVSVDIQSPKVKRSKPVRQTSMEYCHSPPASAKRTTKNHWNHIISGDSRRSSLASMITQKIAHSERHIKNKLKAAQFHSLDLPSIQLADFSESTDRSASPRSSVTSSLLVPSSPPSAVLSERRSSQGFLEVPTEQYLTVPSPHRRFSR